MPRTTVAQCEAALQKHAGMVAAAAAQLGITRQALNQRILKTPRLQQTRRAIVETISDNAEGVIIEAIVNKKDVTTARWWLERMAKDRGWGTEVRLATDQLRQIVDGIKDNADAMRELKEELLDAAD